MKKYERITAIITSLGGVWIMYYAWHTLKLGSIHVPDAGLLPFLCGASLVILGIVWIVILQWKKEREDGEPAEQRLWHRPLLSLVLMVLYGWAMEPVGYITSTFIFVIAWQKVIEHEKWLKTMIIALLGTFAMYALFVYLLKVPIPPEFFAG
ncbi:MAG: tripartite tricarboxylate transporter TctB family protein [Syntrophales bacterium]|nr:tripartite tricarboxylate transporter TctB family protein [Syntrophales bacterium]